MRALDPHDPRPTYLQLADALAEAIESEELPPEAQLPGRSTLADEFGVAQMTVQRALGELRSRGLIVGVQGKGTFVSKELPARMPGLAERVASLELRLAKVEQALAECTSHRHSKAK